MCYVVVLKLRFLCPQGGWISGSGQENIPESQGLLEQQVLRRASCSAFIKRPHPFIIIIIIIIFIRIFLV